jgi:hypothetical protein
MRMRHQDYVELLQLRRLERRAYETMRPDGNQWTQGDSNPFEQGRVTYQAHAEEIDQ